MRPGCTVPEHVFFFDPPSRPELSSKKSFGSWYCVRARLVCFLHWDNDVRMCMLVCDGSRAECWAPSRVPSMALAHDAESLNAIAATSAAASRASFREKLGRSDVEVSCACPLACPCVFASTLDVFVSVLHLCFMQGILVPWEMAAASHRRRCCDTPGGWWSVGSACLMRCIYCATMPLVMVCTHRSIGSTN